ncbi:MAG: NUDIX domain-containing protein [Candidatus Nomurabacteria bacterium]|jgi:ADP-ribose pyrophosphatase YjhB (NUDIX family)|nr:NUDIX domain-containing protein [Candidatus Nomurabacteria bacterium]
MDEIYHNIEKHIVEVLAVKSLARFSEMRPRRVDSNLYAYHLKNLIKRGYVAKVERGYELSPKGLEYADRYVNLDHRAILQPKITTGILVKNEYNEIILSKRRAQPFIDQWCLGLGRIYHDEESTGTAATRNFCEKTGARIERPRYAGDCYVQIRVDGYYMSDILVHMFCKEVAKDSVRLGDDAEWFSLRELDRVDLMPSVKELVGLVDAQRGRFFKKMFFDIASDGSFSKFRMVD